MNCSNSEWQVRLDLAALYRVFDYYGWTALTYSHISGRVPEEPNHYLINRYGLLFEEITASNLIKVNFDGEVTDGESTYNEAGKVIHTAVLQARPEINFVLHSHTRAGIAVSAMESRLLPISQAAGFVATTLGYHQYSFLEDTKSLVRDLANNYALMLHNHGFLICGRTAGEAFLYHYFLQQACEIQVSVLHDRGKYLRLTDEMLARLSAWGAPRQNPWGSTEWTALLRMLDRSRPAYRT